MKFSYLSGYPDDTVQQIEAMLQAHKLGPWLLKKYPQGHGLRDDRALFDYVQGLKQDYLKGASPLSKVLYDNKLHLVKNALGTHTNIARVQGSRLKAKREIRIASLFKDTPLEFLRMIAVHELAHLHERDHDKNFYKLCSYMEPNYHQLEFDVRVYLTFLDTSTHRLWS
jgi:predicted metal-dependent hydrolase